MFFPPETKDSIDSTKQASGPRRENSPSETIDMFFLGLKAGQIDAAYDGLVKGSVIADRREDVANLKDPTRHAMDEFGPISGYELLRKRQLAAHFSVEPASPSIRICRCAGDFTSTRLRGRGSWSTCASMTVWWSFSRKVSAHENDQPLP